MSAAEIWCSMLLLLMSLYRPNDGATAMGRLLRLLLSSRR
jgi:hypothetical protein